MRVDKLFYLNPKNNVSKYADFINYIDTSSVNHGRLDEVALLTEDFPSRAQRKVLQGDILYSSVRPNLRHYHLYTSSFDHVVASTGFVLLRKKREDTNEKFVYYYLSTNSVVDYLTNIAELSQATFPSFSPKDLGRIELPNFTFFAQGKIARILSAYDALIDNNNKRIKLLEQMAQNLYREWFVRFRFPGHENSEFVDGLPKGWCRTTIKSLGVEIETGSRPKGGITDIDDGIPSIGAENVIGLGKYNFNSIKLIPFDFFNQLKRGVIHDKDILIYKDGAYIGRTSLFQDMFPHEKAAVNEHVFLLRTNEPKFQYYLFFTLYQSIYFDLMQNLNTNAAQPGLNQSHILHIPLEVPTDEILHNFNKDVTPLIKSIFNLCKSNVQLARQRDALLPRLMSGKLEVKP